jgi:predicted membrane-bound spermidine synthase
MYAEDSRTSATDASPWQRLRPCYDPLPLAYQACMARRTPAGGRVAVLGLGTGALCGRLAGTSHVMGVDCDAGVIALANTLFGLERTQVECADALAWLARTGDVWDAIIIDLDAPEAPRGEQAHAESFRRFIPRPGALSRPNDGSGGDE